MQDEYKLVVLILLCEYLQDTVGHPNKFKQTEEYRNFPYTLHEDKHVNQHKIKVVYGAKGYDKHNQPFNETFYDEARLPRYRSDVQDAVKLLFSRISKYLPKIGIDLGFPNCFAHIGYWRDGIWDHIDHPIFLQCIGVLFVHETIREIKV